MAIITLGAPLVLHRSSLVAPPMAGTQCCENPPVLSSSCGAGAVEEIAGFKAYVTGSAVSKLAVLLVSDVYGMVFCSVRVHLLFS